MPKKLKNISIVPGKNGLLSDTDQAVLTHYLQNPENPLFYTEANRILENLVACNPEVPELCDKVMNSAKRAVDNVPFIAILNPRFTFVDLFAGIGGFRIAMQSLGGKCVFSSEWDKEAQKTYLANFGEVPFGDITREETKRFIPDEFDVQAKNGDLTRRGERYFSMLPKLYAGKDRKPYFWKT